MLKLAFIDNKRDIAQLFYILPLLLWNTLSLTKLNHKGCSKANKTMALLCHRTYVLRN